MSLFRIFVTLVVFGMSLTGCKSSTTDEVPWETVEEEPPTEPAKQLAGLAIEPTEATVLIGTERELVVMATWDDGSTENVTSEASWEVGNESLLTVDDGIVRPDSPGSTTVTAYYEEFTAQSLITVPSARPAELAIEPSNVSLSVGDTLRLTALATLTDGSELDATELVDWSSGDPGIADVSTSPPEQGTVRGVADGNAVVRARLGELLAELTVTVGSSAQLAGIELAPPAVRMVLDQTTRVQVLGRYSDGSTSDVTQVATLSSSDEMIATVAGNGVVQAHSSGEAQIEAELQGHVVVAPVTVTDADVVEIDVTPQTSVTAPGGAVDHTATAVLDDGTTLDFDAVVDWRSIDTAVATVNGTGIALADQSGTTTIEARYGDVVGSATVEVVDAELRAIELEPVDPVGVVGTRWEFVAMGRYDGGLVADLSHSCEWSSSNPAVVAVQRPGAATANATGTSVVSCEWSGSVGQSTVTVTPNDLEMLTIEPTSVTVGVGETTALRVIGQHMDGRTEDYTESATWSSDSAAVAVSNLAGVRGEATGLATGNAEVRADFAGLSAAATVRVSDAALQSIELSPDPVEVPAGATIRVTATGTYDDGTERDLTSLAAWTTDDTSIATAGNGPAAGEVAGVTSGDTTITATVGDVSGTAPVVVGDAAVERVDLSPADLITTRGLRTNYEATAVYSDGSTVDVTDMATWSVDDSAVAFIGNSSPRGQLVALETGTTTVRARWSDTEGSTGVTVEGAALESLAITPVAAEAGVGIDTQLVAMATYSDGSKRNVTGRATWSSDKPGIADVNTSGLVEPKQPGEAKITANFNGLTAQTTFTVTDATITEVQVIPFMSTIAAGDQMWFQAVALFSDGTNRNVTRLAVWSSTDDSIAEVQSVAYLAGVTLAKNPGEVTIRANYEGVYGEATVTVTDATVTDISIFPTVYEMAVGTEVFMTAQAVYSDGSSRNVNYLGNWTSSSPEIAEVRNAWPSPGLVTAHAPGDTTITVTYQGVSATAEVTVSDATLETIQVFPFNASITVGSPAWFQATGVFSDGRSVTLTRDVTWTSSDDTVAAISNGRWSEGRTIGVGPGTATIEATWNGVTGSADIVVTDKAITTIQVTPFADSQPAGYGEFYQAVAIFDDATSRNVTQLSTWETDDMAVASIGNVWWTNGLVLTHAPGQVTISAGWQGAEGSTTLTVTDALISSIDVEPKQESLLAGEVLEYTATGSFDDGTTMDVTLFSTWISSDPSVADVSNAWGYRGEATAFTPGTTEVTAHNGGVSGSTTLDVQ